jgi:plasmid stabilization system protein ParE
MKRYSVIITPTAEADIVDSFIWGYYEWGISDAQKWARDIRDAILTRLSTFPMRCPVAPDKDGSKYEYRHLFVGRYRVIFHIEKQTVWVIHVRGAFSSNSVDEYFEGVQE